MTPILVIVLRFGLVLYEGLSAQVARLHRCHTPCSLDEAAAQLTTAGIIETSLCCMFDR
ncbi:hypothetical protein [Methylobacterium sp. J-070]|uniref:hypothetical protein n=1 Tax=Methylobacterium sp. J-070 TaxID=2836650 RepID=UPI001FBAFB6F|nr:hypothetical protein [Methylobacterium sp. J-070]MCJ2049292.1 hypothetical protein [Methylobacterium sp. J-070]